MPRARTVTVVPPLGGVDRSLAVQSSPPFTTPSALNVWPVHYDQSATASTAQPTGNEGRGRIATRPGIATAGISAATGNATPYNWSPAAWTDSQGYYGIAIATSVGARLITADGTTYSRDISAADSFAGDESIASACVGFDTLFYASQGRDDVVFQALTSPAGSDTDLDAATSGVTGTPPAKCGLCAVWQQRLVLSGDFNNGQSAYFSKTGGFKGWDYTETGADAPVTLEIPGIVTTLIPVTNQTIVFGCTDSMYKLTANPAREGILDRVSLSTAPLVQSAWCRVPRFDELWFLGRDGLYKMGNGGLALPEPVSRRRLPDAMVDIDVDGGDKVTIGWDNKFRGIHVYIYDSSGDSYTDWFYHLDTDSFWPMDSTQNIRLCADVPGIRDPTETSLVGFNATGTGYHYDTDSTEAITSYCWLGPVGLGGPGNSGEVTDITGVLAEDPNPASGHASTTTDEVAWTLQVGESPQQAFFNPTASYTGGEWDRAGRNYNQNPNLAGNAAFIKVENQDTSDRWALEAIEMRVAEYGPTEVID